MHFSANLRAIADDAPVNDCLSGNILRRKGAAVGKYLPIFFIQVKLWNNINQLHIRLPVRAESSHIFPVSVILVCKQPLPPFMAVWNNMLPKITSLDVLQCDQSLF